MPKSADILQCQICCRLHPLQVCFSFHQMTVTERVEAVRTHKYCANCLARSHISKFCTSTNRCRWCQGNHHTMLHQDEPKAHQPTPVKQRLTCKCRGCPSSQQPPASRASKSARVVSPLQSTSDHHLTSTAKDGNGVAEAIKGAAPRCTRAREPACPKWTQPNLF